MSYKVHLNACLLPRIHIVFFVPFVDQLLQLFIFNDPLCMRGGIAVRFLGTACESF